MDKQPACFKFIRGLEEMSQGKSYFVGDGTERLQNLFLVIQSSFFDAQQAISDYDKDTEAGKALFRLYHNMNFCLDVSKNLIANYDITVKLKSSDD